MRNYNGLKEFMKECEDVYEWNRRRSMAMRMYDAKLISQLDASGFIKKSLNK